MSLNNKQIFPSKADRKSERFQNVVDVRALNSTAMVCMVRPVLPLSFAAFFKKKKTNFFKYRARSLISYEMVKLSYERM